MGNRSRQGSSSTLTRMAHHSPLAMLVIDPLNDRLVEANLSACHLLSTEHATMMTSTFSHHLSASLPLWISFTDEVLTTGQGWSDDLVLLDSIRQPHRVEVHGQRLDDALLLLTVMDRHKAEQRRAKAELGRQHRQGEVGWRRVEQVFERIEKQNRLILSAAGEGIYGLDAQGRTTFVNPAAERILGWSTEDMVGHDAHLMFHHTRADGGLFPVQQCPIHASFSDGQVHHVDDEVFWHKSGEAIPVEYTSTPIFEMGRLVGAVVLFRDIRERKRAEQQLRDALEEVESLKQRLELENQYLQEEIKAEVNHHDIVGNSPAVAKLIQQTAMVAPTNANVLISGESGTGKELIARAIHASSDRSDRPLIRVNCAAIPRDLFESEFFGHVKGAFTGAVHDRPGRFELAHGGTLFLDEVGEIPLELQSKLLRVLQDQQFERVGDNHTREVDVRVIAATNRDLKEMIDAGQFREDLYFRLNVFPIDSVPLRKRIEDVPLLAHHFLNRARLKFNKPNVRIAPSQLDVLKRYTWPGNIRELENVIERQVIVTQGSDLSFDDFLLSESRPSHTTLNMKAKEPHAPDYPMTEQALCQHQRINALKALEAANGKISGVGGAAETLGLKPTTLASRLYKWGIDPRQFRKNKRKRDAAS
ncbi:sigma 54-interacting transcriptional regulator [Halomonas dongshanensis]|uniref:Sigma 54-interacting transcriptional regulator n=1 Tax=Halomonas dongshanensis TaxID=2890835 RepID=A0ABT2EC87_9GAMM|nr:sigma 54-interacting transcriptional regulator [Halomonas dongshanensis]MCS2608257.1 sigma 54-interacting transcriptional regulator [Halomonas dongshanensis]